MPEYYVIPTIGQFKVTITPTYDRTDTQKVLFYVLNVGGNTDKCVNITLYPEDSPNSKELILSWTEVIDKSCTTDLQIIKGTATVEMLQLAFTIAKEIASHAEYVKLDDMSYFICDTPDGKRKVSLPAYYIAFNDKTWYEDKFNAVMMNASSYDAYKAYIENMYTEQTLPAHFDFGNARLRDILYPLYERAKSWKQFFKLIAKHYPHDKCTLMYPWINSAMNIIFENNKLYIGQAWKIDLNTIPKIHYYQLDRPHIAQHGSGTKNTHVYQAYNYNDITNNVIDWDIDAFLKRRKRKKTATRKNKLVF